MLGVKRRISKAGKTDGGQLACPKCGGASFKAKRSLGGKLMLGVVAPKSQVKCVTCGKTFWRG